MKTLSIGIVLASTLVGLQAQVPASSTSLGQSPTDYSIVSQDGNSRVWARTVYETSANGAVIPRKHSFIELQAGVNHLVAGQWMPSTEEIDVLPDGSAAATNCQHQVYFPGDIYEGDITVVTPASQTLQSQPFILCYTDGTNIQVLGELTNSTGELVSSNQMVYPNAFQGIKADILYSNTKGGLEQDIILRQQPPSPSSFGLDPTKTRLEVMTEFFDPPAPELTGGVTDTADGIQDTRINFGDMQMALGKAFSTEDSQQNITDGATVFKNWIMVQGRTFLVEMLPYKNITQQLQTLPLQASISRPAGSFKMAMAAPVSTFTLPLAHPVKPSKQPILLAKADYHKAPGVVLDYVLLGSVYGNFTFQADMTYLMTGSSYFEIDGLATFEGNTVIKFSPSTAGFQLEYGGVSCLSGPYRPIILTASDDNTVGETVSGSTGSPSGYYGNGINIYENNGVTLHDIRMSYLNSGFIVWATTEFDNIQAVNCSTPIMHEFVPVTINNGLFYNITNVAVLSENTPTSVSGTQLTIDNCNTFADSTTPSLTLANCLVTATTNLLAGSGTLTTNDVVILASNAGVYQVVGGGGHYLATNSPYRSAGSTNNVSSNILAQITQKTTYPPQVFDSISFSSVTNLSPKVARDTNTSLDLGYHYDPLDYVFGGCDLFTNLTFTGGAAVGWFQDYGGVSSSGQPYGISLNNGANLTSIGTPTQPNWIVYFLLVQEGGNGAWGNRGWMGGIMLNGSGSPPVPQLNAQFTKWSAVPGLAGPYRDNWAYGQVYVSDSEYYNAGFVSVSGYNSMYYTNCLFYRTIAEFDSQDQASSFTFQNCTFYNGLLSAARFSGQAPSYWMVENTSFDGTAFQFGDNYNGTNYTAFDYNAYNTNNLSWETYPYPYPVVTNFLEVVGPHDITNLTTFNWQSSWLGNFYLPTNSQLIKAGSTTSDQLGLYYYTTQTNQMIESNAVVDIGYHYVALGTNGLPLTDTNGIPFYLESGLDPDGSGLPIWWELLYFGYTGVNPNGYATGDGLTNLQKYQAGLNPNVDASTLSTARLNYIYDAGGWLNQVSGIRSGTVTPDNQGNIESSSQ